MVLLLIITIIILMVLLVNLELINWVPGYWLLFISYLLVYDTIN